MFSRPGRHSAVSRGPLGFEVRSDGDERLPVCVTLLRLTLLAIRAGALGATSIGTSSIVCVLARFAAPAWRRARLRAIALDLSVRRAESPAPKKHREQRTSATAKWVNVKFMSQHSLSECLPLPGVQSSLMGR